jgi:hypothetical protein
MEMDEGRRQVVLALVEKHFGRTLVPSATAA